MKHFVLCFFFKDEEHDFPLPSWIPKLHKCPYKHRHITISTRSSSRSLFNEIALMSPAIITGLLFYKRSESDVDTQVARLCFTF